MDIKTDRVGCCYLVDSENIKDTWIDLLDFMKEEDRLLVFYTTNSAHIRCEQVEKIMQKNDGRVSWIQCYEGNNALDFQLVTRLGAMVAEQKAQEYVIISKDTGFDAVVKFWSREGIQIRRSRGAQEEASLLRRRAPGKKESSKGHGKHGGANLPGEQGMGSASPAGVLMRGSAKVQAGTGTSLEASDALEASGTAKSTAASEMPDTLEGSGASEASGTAKSTAVSEMPDILEGSGASEASGTARSTAVTEMPGTLGGSGVSVASGTAKSTAASEMPGTLEGSGASVASGIVKSGTASEKIRTSGASGASGASEASSIVRSTSVSESSGSPESSEAPEAPPSNSYGSFWTTEESGAYSGEETDGSWGRESEQESAQMVIEQRSSRGAKKKDDKKKGDKHSKKKDKLTPREKNIGRMAKSIDITDMSMFHNAFVAFFGAQEGDEYYRELKNLGETRSKYAKSYLKDKHQRTRNYVELMLELDGMDTKDASELYRMLSKAPKKDLQKLNSLVTRKFGTKKGGQYYKLLKRHVNILRNI